MRQRHRFHLPFVFGNGGHECCSNCVILILDHSQDSCDGSYFFFLLALLSGIGSRFYWDGSFLRLRFLFFVGSIQ